MKREGYISWDEFFMGVSVLASKRNKDPNTQVGACIVNDDNIILSTGYNGFPMGCSDDEYSWEREGEDTKYPYVVHAELNAILNANGKSLRIPRIYVYLFPCNECAKAIIQAGKGGHLHNATNMPTTRTPRRRKKCFRRRGLFLKSLNRSSRKIELEF